MKQGKLNLQSLKNIFHYIFGDEHKISWKLILKFAYFGYHFKDSDIRYLNKDTKLSFETIEKILK